MDYLTEQELIDGYLNPDVEAASNTDERSQWITAASAEVDSYLRRAGYELPLATYGGDIKVATGSIAAYRLASKLGIVPEPAVKSDLYLNFQAAIKWLEGVANHHISPGVEDGSSPSADGDSGFLISTHPKRGW